MNENRPVVNEPLFMIKGLGLIVSFFIGVFCVFFFIWRQNYDASGSALVLELACVSLLNLNNTYKKGKLREKVKMGILTLLMAIGIIIGITMFSSTIFYAYTTVRLEEGMDQYGHGPPAVLSALASFWGFVLFFDCYRFRRILDPTIAGAI